MELNRWKNTETRIVFPLKDASGNLVSGASASAQIDTFSDSSNPDGFSASTNSVTEIGSSGYYYLVLTSSEMNADYIVVSVSATDVLTQTILIKTYVPMFAVQT